MKEFFSNPAVWSIVLFFVLTLINVILGTMRSILTVKSTPFVSMVINTVSYTFYSGIVKLVSGQDMAVVLITTALTNIIGVYIAQFILNKAKKDRLWRITATVKYNKSKDIANALEQYNISYNEQATDGNKTAIFDIFSKTQGESALMQNIMLSKSKKLCKIFVKRYELVRISLSLYYAKVPARLAICTKFARSICAILHIAFSVSV